jgi:hypothetical protein
MPPENELENDPENDFVNELENELENEGNRLSDEKNAGENENAFLENDSEMNVENAEKMNVENDSEIEGELEGYFLDPDDFEDQLEERSEDEELEDEFDFPEDEEDIEEDDEFDFPEDEEEEDSLDDAISGGSEDTGVDELLSDLTGDSVKNLELLEELGELAMEKIDDSKAMLCSAISGESPARYASDKKLNKALLKAFANYLRSSNVKKPSPLGSLLLVLAMWGLPTLGAAFFHRSKAKKAAKKQAVKKAKAAGDSIVEDIEIEGEAQSDSEEGIFDYTNLKEHQENRQMFTVHKTSGCYNRTPKGQFARITLASEKPSPEIQRMLDEELTSAAIRERIYNE